MRLMKVLCLLLLVNLNHISASPQLTDENLRWYLPGDAWTFYKGYISKGTFLRITNKAKDISSNDVVKGIRIYNNPDFKGTPYILNYSRVTDQTGHLICSGETSFETNYDLDKLLICDRFCSEIDESSRIKQTKKEGKLSGIAFYKNYFSSSMYGDCKIRIDGFIKHFLIKNGSNQDLLSKTLPYMSQNTDSATNIYFRTKDVDFKKGYIRLEAGDKNYYLDVAFCQKNSICTFVKIDKSEFEQEWDQLETIKSKKNFEPLNFFITNLKPCLLKKDKECIKKFFPKPLTKEETEMDGLYQYKDVTIDDELIKELLSCLSYQSLLPHLLAMRGINKACIMRLPDINNPQLLVVDYPEAVRYREDFPIAVIKE